MSVEAPRGMIVAVSRVEAESLSSSYLVLVVPFPQCLGARRSFLSSLYAAAGDALTDDAMGGDADGGPVREPSELEVVKQLLCCSRRSLNTAYFVLGLAKGNGYPV